MYLVNISTLQLEDFIEGSAPAYAILSHRWTGEELTFKEVNKKRTDTAKSGYGKLINACAIAAYYSVDYIWVDTCCIDKKSSAELSEAINSMYSWYANSEVCIAYLADVYADELKDQDYKPFRDSVWFTRLWTLQELIAPIKVHFFDVDWLYLGSKRSLVGHIHLATDVEKQVLLGDEDPNSLSIATKMSWARCREATRVEDVAYGLLGLFDINMPMLYGEKGKAYLRLQEEISRRSRNLSFLLWGSGKVNHNLFAPSPAEFNLNFQFSGSRFYKSNTPFTITNIGLEADLCIRRWCRETYIVLLASDALRRTVYAVFLRKYRNSNILLRASATELRIDQLFKEIRRNLKTTRITIGRDLECAGVDHWVVPKDCDPNPARDIGFGFKLETLNCITSDYSLHIRPTEDDPILISGQAKWKYDDTDQHPSCQLTCNNKPSYAVIDFDFHTYSGQQSQFAAVFFFDFAFNVCIYIHGQIRNPEHSAETVTRIVEEVSSNSLQPVNGLETRLPTKVGVNLVETIEIESAKGAEIYRVKDRGDSTASILYWLKIKDGSNNVTVLVRIYVVAPVRAYDMWSIGAEVLSITVK